MHGEFDAPDGDEELEEADINALLERYKESIGKFTAEQRAYTMIRTYLELENPNYKIYSKFADWFLDGRNRDAKERAMERMFDEILTAGRDKMEKKESGESGESVKAERFEQRIRRLYSDDVPKNEQDLIRTWLAGDEDSDLKRDILCEVMLSVSLPDDGADQCEAEPVCGNWPELVRALGVDPDPEQLSALWLEKTI